MASRTLSARFIARCRPGSSQLSFSSSSRASAQSRRAFTSSSTAAFLGRSSRSAQYAAAAAVAAAVTAATYAYYATSAPIHLQSMSLVENDELEKRENGVTDTSPMRLRMEQFIKEQQQEIIKALAEVDGKPFRVDEWQRAEGGYGITCVLQEGNVFEKGGVGVSVIYGTLGKQAIQRMRLTHANLGSTANGELPDKLDFFAAGLSLVVHPHNPMAPTIHLNYRYFETVNPDGTTAWWFGGGSDLTPSYLFEEDAIFFHGQLKEACDRHDPAYYPRFKKWCDDYFFVKHRGESRGIGGIFFDDLDESEIADKERGFAFIRDALRSFVPTYVPIINRRKDMPFTAAEKDWQQVRRGRYVEFNLVHDRGTAFGLHTPGARVESILMSLPLTATWKYMHEVPPRSREQKLVDVLRTPREWV